VSWAAYWNRKTSIYVNDRHRRVHYERVSRDLIRCLPGPGARVVDYGCGDTLCALRVADGCAHLFLCDSAPTVRESLAARYAGCANISVISPEQFERLDAGTIDAIVANSVIQYLSAAEFARLLSLSREKLRPGGRLVLGDVIPRSIGPLRDALELLKFAGANGFLLAAAAGLVKSYFSDYPRLRREAGFLQFEEAELLQELARAGFAAERYRPNVGHNSARMTFVAVVPADGRDAPSTSAPGSNDCPWTAPPGGGGPAAAAGLEGSGDPQARAFWGQDYLLAACVFAGAWLFLSLPWLSGAVTIPYDAKALFQAQLQFLANALHSGQSPFWNPGTFVGVPHIADPQSLIFSPAILLALFERVPSFRELDAFVLSLLGLGGLAILKFCQDRGWHPAGGVVAAIAFAFGASAAWRIQHIAQIQSLAFFAVALWLLARALDRSSARWGALAGLAAGSMAVKPDQVALLGCYVLAGYCASHWLLAPGRLLALRRSVRPLACCALAATACAALPVLLTYLFLADSNRPEIAFSEAARGSLHPASLLTGLVADLFGAFDHDVAYWGPYSEWWDKNELTLSQNMGQVYIGTLPILLILTVGLMRGLLWAREIRFFGIAAGVLLIYALGRYTPAFAILYGYLPGVSFFRRPVDGVFLVGALLSVAAGYLVHLWATAAVPAASSRRRACEAGAIAAILLAALAVAWSADMTALAWKPLMLALLWISITSILLATPAAWIGRSRRMAVLAPALLLSIDLALNNGPNESTALPPSAYEVLNPNSRCETIRFLNAHLRRADGSPWRDRVELVGLGFEWQNAALVHRLEGTLGYNPFRLGEVSDATGARDYIAGADQKWFAPLFPSYASMMANLLGLRFIVLGVPIEQVDPLLKPGDLKLVARTAEAFVYENPRALPRVLFVKDWQKADFDKLVASGDWPRFDPTRTVLLDEAPEIDEAVVRLARHAGVGSHVRIRHYENTKVVIDVQAERSGFVVLHDVWHPWWTADIDGVETPILRANILFRAVQVPAGHHILTFEFRPFSRAIEDLADRLLESDD
jgi:SAM-dependent methyltransferase